MMSSTRGVSWRHGCSKGGCGNFIIYTSSKCGQGGGVQKFFVGVPYGWPIWRSSGGEARVGHKLGMRLIGVILFRYKEWKRVEVPKNSRDYLMASISLDFHSRTIGEARRTTCRLAHKKFCVWSVVMCLFKGFWNLWCSNNGLVSTRCPGAIN